MNKIFFSIFFLSQFLYSSAQSVTFPNNGPADAREGCYAFTNATIFKSYNEKIEAATLIIRNGKIENIGKNVTIPKDAIVSNLNGKFIYPSFVEIYSNYGLPAPKAEGSAPSQRPQMLSNKRGAYSWNEALKTEFSAYQSFSADKEQAKTYRNIGFGTVLTHRMDGVSRGTGALVTLSDEKEHKTILKADAAHFLSFRKGTSTQDYPTSLVGCIALLRQTYYDAQWYAAQGNKEELNVSLAAWNAVQPLPQVFEISDKLDALRVNKIGKEFNVTFILKGNGDEYQRIEAIKATKYPLIVGLNFPETMDVEDPFDAQQTTLSELKHWELAPSNAARLAKVGVEFALTSAGLKKREDFFKMLRKAIENGLSEEDALKALTHTPARLAGASDKIGSLDIGKGANFLITSGNIFAKENKIYTNFIQGKSFDINDLDIKIASGNYDLKVGDSLYQLAVKGNIEKQNMTLRSVRDSSERKVEFSLEDNLISLSFQLGGEVGKFIRLSGSIENKNWAGRGMSPEGNWLAWSATFLDDNLKEIKKDTIPKNAEEVGEIIYPFVAYGQTKIAEQKSFLIKNVTIWTNEKDGILQESDLLVSGGKIVEIGKKLIVPPNATVIDGSGKHLTAGIIDEHSHIALSRGVNEGSQESTAEVRMGDVINSDDVNIYRQLAGGVTVSHLLHGSANPIGGQTTLIKLRWGYEPEAMKMENTDGFIKFALGENVKQANWGDAYGTRFPQSRMGVEQVFEDYFTRAKEYLSATKGNKLVRKDLDLEAIGEILEQKRFITCHSYVQSEINMLMKLADKMKFKVNTFTHILEGYKVASQMAKHGAAGSTFADWWAYKYEVIDAIPYNAALMARQNVTVGINSDDAEMARRLNQEAAKTQLYGNVPEEEALKFVTLNPAKMLHIDNRTGSLKKGKDADLVLWNGHPLSVYSSVDMTFVDGIKFFDKKEDNQKRTELRKERNRIIQKMIAAKKSGGSTVPVQPKPKKLYHCDDIECEIN